jgi:hypothetical protein
MVVMCLGTTLVARFIKNDQYKIVNKTSKCLDENDTKVEEEEECLRYIPIKGITLQFSTSSGL